MINNAMSLVQESCIVKCNGLCCRSGVTDIKSEEVDLVCNGRRKELEENGGLVRLDSGDYRLILKNRQCPSLIFEKGKAYCKIHNNARKPLMCKDYPLFVDNEKKVVTIFTNCPVVLSGRLNLFLEKIKESGYEVNKKKSCSNL